MVTSSVVVRIRGLNSKTGVWYTHNKNLDKNKVYLILVKYLSSKILKKSILVWLIFLKRWSKHIVAENSVLGLTKGD